ncbi:hypothetical protein IEQ34_021398 [Dendrobium chrysotoxum]|uniref:Uncharacterized protein n=1 Tax=Dendrobium chrysotoxum TaxID=161865 RepID=A0AAV7G2U6_DENCH|nr:hypothetical protein IEQ34_021398 [Dendrobium chrysotoxum]
MVRAKAIEEVSWPANRRLRSREGDSLLPGGHHHEGLPLYLRQEDGSETGAAEKIKRDHSHALMHLPNQHQH